MNEEMLLVQSKVRDAAKAVDGEIRMSDGFIDALNKKVQKQLEEAVSRCKTNGRKTLQEQDV